MKTKSPLLVLLPVVLGLAACTSVALSNDDYQTGTDKLEEPPEALSESRTETSEAITEAGLKNMTYQDIYDKPVTLADGLYEGAPFVNNAASKPTLTFISPAVFGDLNEDGVDDAAVLLVENSGGSGSFVYLAAVVNNGGVPENVATTLLGDRVEPEAFAIVHGEIIVEATSHTEDDPLRCPSLKTVTAYTLLNGEIAVVRTESTTKSGVTKETAVPEELVGAWRWLAYQDTAGINNTIVSNPDEYVIEFLADGTAQIKADCNLARSNLIIDGDTLIFTPGPMTLAECEPGSLYDEYLAKLSDVVTYILDDDGHLALNLKMDAGNMIFTPVSEASNR